MKRVASNGNVISFPKHLIGKSPKDCMCPFCEVILEAGVEDKLEVLYPRERGDYLLQALIQAGESLSVPRFKEAIKAANIEVGKNYREESGGPPRAATRSAISIHRHCNTTTGSVRTISEQTDKIAKVLFTPAERLIYKCELYISRSFQCLKSTLYRKLRIKKS